MKTTIDRAGRMVIPKSIRESVGLEPGMEIVIRAINGIIEISPAAPEGHLVERDGLPVWESAGPKVSLEEINAAIESSRVARVRS